MKHKQEIENARLRQRFGYWRRSRRYFNRGVPFRIVLVVECGPI